MRLIALAMAVTLSLANPFVLSAAATNIETVPSSPPLTNGPFIISGYAFSGHSVRYVQIANVSKTVAAIDGWKIKANFGGNSWELGDLSGQIAPNKKVVVADKSLVPTATFQFSATELPSDPILDNLVLLPPAGSGFSEHLIEVVVKSTTVRDATTSPASFYFSRNISGSNGEYLATFTAVPKPAELVDDGLYEPPTTSPLRIVEIYPNSLDCTPDKDSPECYDYVKLFNPADSQVKLGDYVLKIGSVSSNSTVYPKGELAPGGFATVLVNLSDSGNNIWLEDAFSTTVYQETVVHYDSAAKYQGQAWSYNNSADKWQWTMPTPQNTPNQFLPEKPVNVCNGLKLSEIGANYSPQFIEVYNSSSAPLDVSGCQLMTNRSSTAHFIFADGQTLEPGQFQEIAVAETGLTLTKTTSGTVYLLSSDGNLEVDARNYDNLAENTSLALVDGLWQQSFSVTPGKANVYEKYPPCQTGYTRNELTGNCNKIVLAVASLAECPDGYYRNPATNRCKKIEVATLATLAACPDGYYRNPETNRCKKIASSEDELVPCAAGYERNPETNRCRKILSANTEAASGDSQTVTKKGPSTSDAVVWSVAAVGGAGALAYGLYEWRHELAKLKDKILSKIRKTK